MSIKLSDQHVPVAKMRPREYIKIRGAAEHNLKNLDVDIPRNELVVLTGLSGSCLLYTSRRQCEVCRRPAEGSVE